MDQLDQLRHLGGLLRRYYGPEFREPLSEDILTLAAALEERLRGRELLQVEAPQAVRKPVKLTLVHSEAESSPKHFANA